MTRLILSELLNSARVWVGVLALSVVTGAVGFVAAAFVVSGGHASGDARQLTASAGQMLIAFTSISALVGLAGASNLTVALQRRSLALWQLAGVRPATVGFAVLAQLAIVGAVGAGIGCLIAIPVVDPFFSWVQRSWTGIDGIELRVGPGAAISTVAIVCGVVALGGLRGALAASRVAPIDALRKPESRHRGMGWGRLPSPGVSTMRRSSTLSTAACSSSRPSPRAPPRSVRSSSPSSCERGPRSSRPDSHPPGSSLVTMRAIG